MVWEPDRKLFESSIGEDVIKIAIVAGRKRYAEVWGMKNGKPVLVDIDPAYDNIDSYIKTMRSLGI